MSGARVVSPEERLTVRRGDPVVVLAVDGAAPEQEPALAHSWAALARNTPPPTPIILAAAGPVAELPLDGEREVLVLPRATVVEAVAAAATMAGSADLAIVSSGATVGPDWLEGLRRAAHSDATVATATALADGGGPLGLPWRVPEDRVDKEAAAVGA